MLDFDTNNHKPLRDIVYEELRNQILTSKIEPGTRMMEIDLAEKMDVSRTPIREAIRKLEEEGLVIIKPRKGAYVSDVSIPDIVNILEVREHFDGIAAYYAAQRITDEQKKELQKVASKFDKAVSDGNMDDMIKYDARFHKIIVEGANNNYLAVMVERVQELVLRFRYIYYKDYNRAEEVPNEHVMIMEAIFSGNAEMAKDESEKHIHQLKELMLTEKDSFTTF